jgi:hypothetical protein
VHTILLIVRISKAKYFLPRGWTAFTEDGPTSKSVAAQSTRPRVCEAPRADSREKKLHFFGASAFARRASAHKPRLARSMRPQGSKREDRYLIVACTVMTDVPEAVGP